MTLSATTLQPGDSFEAEVATDLGRAQIAMYAGASGDFNALHVDEAFARASGMPSVFAHGMLTMGVTAKVLTDTVGDGRLLRYGARFVKQVWPGDTLTAVATVTDVRDGEAELEVVTRNQEGEVVLTATATARIDP